MKKLTLKKVELFNLEESRMNELIGGGTGSICIAQLSNATPESCVDSCMAFCGGGGGTNPYCGTLNNCGTGQAYCVTNGCFFETNANIC